MLAAEDVNVRADLDEDEYGGSVANVLPDPFYLSFSESLTLQRPCSIGLRLFDRFQLDPPFVLADGGERVVNVRNSGAGFRLYSSEKAQGTYVPPEPIPKARLASHRLVDAETQCFAGLLQRLRTEFPRPTALAAWDFGIAELLACDRFHDLRLLRQVLETDDVLVALIRLRGLLRGFVGFRRLLSALLHLLLGRLGFGFDFRLFGLFFVVLFILFVVVTGVVVCVEVQGCGGECDKAAHVFSDNTQVQGLRDPSSSFALRTPIRLWCRLPTDSKT